jgi:hypothetical protein
MQYGVFPGRRGVASAPYTLSDLSCRKPFLSWGVGCRGIEGGEGGEVDTMNLHEGGGSLGGWKQMRARAQNNFVHSAFH